jgi:hypothetical protein
MSDQALRELGRLAAEVGDRAVPPSFDEVLGRARRRRRSRRSTAAVGAAVLVGAVAVVGVVTRDPAPAPAPPASPAGLPGEVRDLVRAPRSHPFEMVGGDDGSLAIVWRNLVQPGPTFALVVRDADGEVHGRLLDQPLDLTAVRGGWVGTRSGTTGWRISPEGSFTRLEVDEAHLVARTGDVLVPAAGEVPLLYRPSTDRLAHPEQSSGLPELVTESGNLLTYDPGPSPANVSLDGVTVALPAGTMGIVTAVSGDLAAVVAQGDAPDGSIPVLGLAVIDDARGSGRSFDGRELGIRDLGSLVVTDDGVVLVTDGDGRLTRLGRDGFLEPADDPPLVRGLTIGGSRVYGVAANDDHGPLLWSDDDGATWHSDTLPGM